MPTTFAEPLLTVDVEKMNQIDLGNSETLFSMWSVFNRCAGAMDQGRRYENLSWRLWNREALCAAQRTPRSAFLDCTPRPSTKNLPQLSTSVESTSSEEYSRASNGHAAHARPVVIHEPSRRAAADERGLARPMPACALEKMVLSIKETKIHQRGDMTGLAPAVAAAVRPVLKMADVLPTTARTSGTVPTALKPAPRTSHSSASTVPMSSPESAVTRSITCGSETSAEFISTPDVVRGFTPTSISQHRTSLHASPRPDPVPIRSSLRQSADPVSAKQAKFLLGGSSEEESSSLEDQLSLRAKAAATRAAPAVKQASFSNQVETRFVVDEGAIASDDDDVDESAIDEDDEDDEEEWDDYSDHEDVPVAPQFKRIDSTSRLPSRRSLLTRGLYQSERKGALLDQAAAAAQGVRRSGPTSPHEPSLAASVDEDAPMEMQGIKITRTKPTLGATVHPPALSPRTTRRNMLATELTESLRKHLLWERQQKNTTANAHLKRRHTSHDVAHLQQYPASGNGAGAAANGSGAGSRTSSWNNVFDTGVGEYHSRGW